MSGAPYPTKMHVMGRTGDVLLFDSRLWHAVAPNRGTKARVAMVARYAPWWLNLTVQWRGSADHKRMVLETGGKASEVPPVPREVYESLPIRAKPLFRHWIEG